jgi:hypothetical protein
MKKWIIRILLIVLIGIQFIPVDRTNKPTDESKTLVAMTSAPEEVAEILETACYNCHSHNTQWPWYGYVAPVSWLLADHIDHAQGHLNMSDWAQYPADEAEHKLEEVYEEVEEGEMPLPGYVLMHGEADLSDEQKETLIAFFKSL